MPPSTTDQTSIIDAATQGRTPTQVIHRLDAHHYPDRRPPAPARPVRPGDDEIRRRVLRLRYSREIAFTIMAWTGAGLLAVAGGFALALVVQGLAR